MTNQANIAFTLTAAANIVTSVRSQVFAVRSADPSDANYRTLRKAQQLAGELADLLHFAAEVEMHEELDDLADAEDGIAFGNIAIR